MFKLKGLGMLALVAYIALIFTTANAQTLDPTFGTGGLATYGSNVQGFDLALDSAGNIFVAGTVLVKFLPDGTLDTTFGSGGVATTLAQTNAIAVDSSGNVFVAGGDSSNHILVKFNSSGVRDTTFGSRGVVTYGASIVSVANDVALDASGNILITGYTYNSVTGRDDVLLLRYTPDGLLDTTFGSSGVVKYTSGGFGDVGRSIAIDSSGNLFVSAFYKNSSGGPGGNVILKYLPDGTLDTTFNGNGVIIYSGSGANDGQDIKVISGGSLYVAGGGSILKFNSSGSLDPSFGTAGIVAFTANGPSTKISLDSSGNIYVVNGTSILKYNTSGTLDTSFGTGGIVTYSSGSGSDLLNSITVDSSGNIFLVGSNNPPPPMMAPHIILLKYNPPVPTDTTPPVAGVVSITPTPANAVAIYQSSTTTISATWSGFSDPESGINHYEWAIGTAMYATNIQTFMPVGLSPSDSNASLMLTSGTTYYVTVKAVNGVGLTTSVSSKGVTVDTTPPSTTGAVVNDTASNNINAADIDVQTSTRTICANWRNFSDPESGIDHYLWAIGTTPGGTNVQGFVNVGAANTYCNTGLTLTVGTTYYSTVEAVNGAGLVSASVSSNGVKVVASIAECGSSVEGTTVWNTNFGDDVITEAIAMYNSNTLYYCSTRNSIFYPKLPTGSTSFQKLSVIISKVTLYDIYASDKVFATFGAAYAVVGNGITVDKDGNVIVVGYTGAFGSVYSGFIVKFRPDGTRYTPFGNIASSGGGINDTVLIRNTYFSKVVTDISGNIYVLNTVNTVGLEKFTPAGQLVEPFGNADIDGNGINDTAKMALYIVPVDLKIDSVGNICVVGNNVGSVSAAFDLTKFDSSGNHIKGFGNTNTDGFPGNDTRRVSSFTATEMVIGAGDNIYVTGGDGFASLIVMGFNDATGGFIQPMGNTDTDGNGTNDTVKFVHPPNIPQSLPILPNNITIDADGNLYLAGSVGYGYSGADTLVIKYCNNGTLDYYKVFNYTNPYFAIFGIQAGGFNYTPTNIFVDGRNNLYIGGRQEDIFYGRITWTNYLLKLINTEEFPQQVDLSAITGPFPQDIAAPPVRIDGPIIEKVAINPNPASIPATITCIALDQSTIYNAEYYIDTDPGQGNGIPLIPSTGIFNSTAPKLTATINISALSNGLHTVYIRAKNGIGNWTDIPLAIAFTVDTTPPVAGVVTINNGQPFQLSTTTISASWAGFADPESDIAQYEWTIGTTSGGQDIQPFASVGLATNATNFLLNLTLGKTYYVTVRATNGAGLTTSVSSSGVTIPIPASVTIEPQIINLKAKGVYTAFITLPSGYNVADIDPATVTANGFAPVSAQAAANKFVAQFDRVGLINAGTGGTRTITINGRMKNGLIFRGQVTVKVTN